MSTFLFELGVEEIPTADILPLQTQIKEGLSARLKDARIAHAPIESSATNRRIMCYISEIAMKTEEIREDLIGPAKRISFLENGEAAIPLQKFMEFNGVNLDELLEIDTAKGVYMGIRRMIPGEATSEILPGILTQLLGSLSFRKAMVWNSSRVPFIRPISHILAMLNRELLPMTFAGINSSLTTRGHRLLSDGMIIVESFEDYLEELNRNFVMLDAEDRRNKIALELRDFEEEFETAIPIPKDMMDHYVFQNEYPVLYSGRFHKKYLDLPQEIISAFMVSEKKLVPVFSPQGELKNAFIGVGNIPDEIGNVSSGTERVITATFEDAQFFWNSDRQADFTSLREKLNSLNFQENLGDYQKKSDRVAALAVQLAEMTAHSQLLDALQIAGQHCKNDLLSQMVREFPSLQGIMGGLYLRESGADEAVWKGVYGHYEPKGFLDSTGLSPVAVFLSLADKADNICGLIGKGVKVSSSKDPFGIRRDASAIIRLIYDHQLDFDLWAFMERGISQYDWPEKSKILEQIKNLFVSRLEQILKEQLNIRYDLANSLLSVLDPRLITLFIRAEQIGPLLNNQASMDLIILHKRLKNITHTVQGIDINPGLFKHPTEEMLYEVFTETAAPFEELIRANRYAEACSLMLEIKPIIDSYFDDILIMDPDLLVRENRLSQLVKLASRIDRVIDFSLIVEQENRSENP